MYVKNPSLLSWLVLKHIKQPFPNTKIKGSLLSYLTLRLEPFFTSIVIMILNSLGNGACWFITKQTYFATSASSPTKASARCRRLEPSKLLPRNFQIDFDQGKTQKTIFVKSINNFTLYVVLDTGNGGIIKESSSPSWHTYTSIQRLKPSTCDSMYDHSQMSTMQVSLKMQNV